MDPKKYGLFAEETDTASEHVAPGSTRRDWVLREIALLDLDQPRSLDLELPPER